MKRQILPEQRVSTRRLTPLRRACNRVLAAIGVRVLQFWWWSCRVVAVSGAENLDAARAQAGSLLPCYWHQHELFCARYLLQQLPRGLRVGFLISPSVDGEIPARIAQQLGATVIRGSSTRTGARALRDFYHLLVRQDVSPVITPDGPTGPRHEFKPGALVLAQLSGRPLLPMAYAASRALRVGWDDFLIPVPGCRIALAVGAPLWVDRQQRLADPAVVAGLQLQMAARLHALQDIAAGLLQDKTLKQQ
jgi:lysophospholipid acyltransferase (LPLAT)-like uncharacterized protein